MITHANTRLTGPTRARRLAALAAFGMAAGAAGLIVGAAAFANAQLNRPTRRGPLSDYTFTPFEVGVANAEQVTFGTVDGLTLHGWWLAHPDAQRTVICLGGHRSVAADMLGIGSGLWRAQTNVLLFDWRSRGRSPAAQHSLAYYELRDAEAAVQYASERAPALPLGVIGYSMGASVSLLLAARQERVRAVVADSPFTSVAEVVADGVRYYGLPPLLVVPLTDALSSLRHGYRFADVRPIDAAPAIAPRPLLLIHGSADTIIPIEHARRIYAAAGQPKQLWIVEGAAHCGAYFADRPTYIERVAAFFAHALDRPFS
jgi:fermentation-respiration switch protein FrsA (DUF1100 family)